MTFCDRPVQPEWSLSVMQALMSLPMNTAVGLIGTRGESCAHSSESICEYGVTLGAEYALLVHDDTAPPPNTIRSLMETMAMDSNIAVAGGIYFTKSEPSDPAVGRKRGLGPSWDWKVGDRFDCEVLGGGCMMVRLSMLKELPKPWFFISEEHTRTQVGDKSAVIRTIESEDVFFCRRVMEAGYRVVADTNVICTHWDVANKRKYEMPENAPMRIVTAATAVAAN